MDDELWFKRQRLQDQLDIVLQEFEEKNKVKIIDLSYFRLDVNDQIYSRVRLVSKKEV